MLLRPSQSPVKPDDPFGEDLLQRTEVSDAMTELAKNSPEGLVISLHAPWGGGKTRFLEMWRSHLKNTGIRSLAFNAWETDFNDDPLVALLGELESGLSELVGNADSDSATKLKQTLRTVKRAGAAILKKSLPTALKVATFGVLDAEELTEEAAGALAERVAEERISSYIASRNSIASLREAIVKAAAVSPDSTVSPTPLVFVIDELDRCRPDYAVRLLECIKHFFAVSGVVYVVAIDREQLSHSIRRAYGEGLDARGYLRRFFDIELTLPDPQDDTFLQAQFYRFGLHEFFEARNSSWQSSHDRQNVAETFWALFRVFSCSLRDQERCFALLSFAIKSTAKNQLLDPHLLSFLIVLKIKAPDLYRSFTRGEISASTLLDQVGHRFEAHEFLRAEDSELLEALIRCSTCNRVQGDALLEHFASLSRRTPEDRDALRAKRILEILRDPGVQRSAFGVLKRAASKLDLIRYK